MNESPTPPVPRTLLQVRILSDGRAGHVNQSLGLAEALQRRTGCTVETVTFPTGSSFWQRLHLAAALDPPTAAATTRSNKPTPPTPPTPPSPPQTLPTSPQLLIAAGHRTHLPLLYAAWRLRARSIVIMRPSLPLTWFSLCLLPRHDLPHPPADAPVHPNPTPAHFTISAPHITTPPRPFLATLGALNRLPETLAAKTGPSMLLIGGPSRHHGWDGDPLRAALREILTVGGPDRAWVLTDSRRTPPGWTATLQQEAHALAATLGVTLRIMPHTDTAPGWLPAQLAAAPEVWVTEDSTSMIFEALTAQARVGLLPLPRLRTNSRVVRGVDEAVQAGRARTLAQWRTHGHTLPPPQPLHEAARCAEEVLARFFPGHQPPRATPPPTPRY